MDGLDDPLDGIVREREPGFHLVSRSRYLAFFPTPIGGGESGENHHTNAETKWDTTPHARSRGRGRLEQTIKITRQGVKQRGEIGHAFELVVRVQTTFGEQKDDFRFEA